MIGTVREVLYQEAQALLGARLDAKEWEGAIECILATRGKLVVMGVGKSGLVGAKIAATLASTGTPSFFVHPTEALHGDLGMIQACDSVLAISYSGESDELKAVLPHIKKLGCPLITMSKSSKSALSQMGDYFLDILVDAEACPLNAAPTSSTTLTLAFGDALAICLMQRRGFGSRDFARFHPGGSLGRRLYLKASDLMQRENLPLITPQTPLKDAIITMSEARLGSAMICEDRHLVAVLSDGDLRRAMLRSDFDFERPALEYATRNPKVSKDTGLLAYEALKLMEENKIQLLVITDASDAILGVLHLHTLIEAGIEAGMR